ncbi:MAG: cytochrome c3 family protein [Thermoanaerobaculia bacterium]|nr:cytochrome c3 family protein [Thermoanaerobaculia bacterium]
MPKLLDSIVLVAVLLVAAIVVAAPHHAPEEVVIDAAVNKRAAVEFPHKLHQENVESCATCHHESEGLTAEADEEVEACSSCHLDPEDPETPSMRELSMKKNPYHILCVDCHKAEEKGPTKCDECHPKAEG